MFQGSFDFYINIKIKQSGCGEKDWLKWRGQVWDFTCNWAIPVASLLLCLVQSLVYHHHASWPLCLSLGFVKWISILLSGFSSYWSMRIHTFVLTYACTYSILAIPTCLVWLVVWQSMKVGNQPCTEEEKSSQRFCFYFSSPFVFKGYIIYGESKRTI